MWLAVLFWLVQASGVPAGCPDTGWVLGVLYEPVDSVAVLAYGDWRHWSSHDLVLVNDSVRAKFSLDLGRSPESVVLRVYEWAGTYWRLAGQVAMAPRGFRCEFYRKLDERRAVVFSCMSEFMWKKPAIQQAGEWRKAA